tara:strand:- start:1078 stop:1275 length:198 start_codon:yes stop_codon:yes gene_type:complete
MSYYNARITITIDNDQGKPKKVPELYLVEAESCTEAEGKVYKDFESFSGDWEVTSVVKTKHLKVI